MKVGDRGVARTFLWPTVIAVTSLTGLIVALLEDGWWDWAGVLLLTPAVASLLVAVRPRRSPSAAEPFQSPARPRRR